MFTSYRSDTKEGFLLHAEAELPHLSHFVTKLVLVSKLTREEKNKRFVSVIRDRPWCGSSVRVEE